MFPEGVCDEVLASRKSLLRGGSGDGGFKRRVMASVHRAVLLMALRNHSYFHLPLSLARKQMVLLRHALLPQCAGSPQPLKQLGSVGYGLAETHKTE